MEKTFTGNPDWQLLSFKEFVSSLAVNMRQQKVVAENFCNLPGPGEKGQRLPRHLGDPTEVSPRFAYKVLLTISTAQKPRGNNKH